MVRGAKLGVFQLGSMSPLGTRSATGGATGDTYQLYHHLQVETPEGMDRMLDYGIVSQHICVALTMKLTL